MEVFVYDVDFIEEFKIITHPSLTEARDRLRNELAHLDFTSHFAIFSSGTSSQKLKGYILSEKAMEANANAVNEWFSLTSQDVWGLSLPVYHVGGLSVLIRAKLLGNKIVDLRKWDPLSWHQTLIKENVTITTIVPTQLYDVVKNKITSPETLKHLIVGGDFLATELETRARSLGWPMIRTYGMTEVCSQLASGKIPGDKLQLLPIHEVKTTSEGILTIKSPSLFTAQFVLSEKLQLTFSQDLIDENGFYETADLVGIAGNTLKPMGRKNDEIKVAGHLTNVFALKDSLAKVLLQHGIFGQAELIVERDERKGYRLVLLHQTMESDTLKEIADALRPAVIDETREIENFSRTDLGKLKHPY
jgi:O-succinylbenzoic acid--CoA ligase